MGRNPGVRLLRVPLPGDMLEAMGGSASTFPVISLALFAGVDSRRQQRAGLVAALARPLGRFELAGFLALFGPRCQGHRRIDAKRQPLFLAVNPVFETPPLAA